MSGAPRQHSDEAHARQRRGTRQLLFGRLTFIASGYGVAVVLARALGPAEYGFYGVLMSLISRIELITGAGVPGATAKLIPDSGGNHAPIEASARFLLLMLALIAFGGCWVAAPWVERTFHIPGGALLFRVAALDIPATAIYASYTGSLGGQRRFGGIAVAQMIYGGAKLAAVLALLALGMSVTRALIANALGTVAACVYFLTRFPPQSFRPHSEVMRRLGAIAVPVGAYMIAAQVLGNLDLWALRVTWRGADEVVGHYVAALNIARTLAVIPTVQSGVLFASMAWALAARDEGAAHRHIQEASRFALLAAAAAWLVLGSDAAALMALIFSPPYAAGGSFLMLQLVGFGLYALLDAYAMCLIAAGRHWLVALSLLALVPAAWIANVLLIPRIGPVGASWALVLGMAAGAAIMGTLTYRRFGGLIAGRTLGRIAGAAAVVWMLGSLVPVAGPLVLVKMAVLAALYLGLLIWWGEVTPGDFGLAGWGRRRGGPAG